MKSNTSNISKKNNTKIATNKTKALAFVSKMAVGFSYIPIFAGILAPMFLTLGAAIYISYIAFGYPFTDWVFYFLYILNDEVITSLHISSWIILIAGGVLFIYSIIFFTIKKRDNPEGIVSSNIYKIFRHPQNLAICIMLLPLSMLISDLYFKNFIRIGDILSWGLSVFFIRILCIVEEVQMLSRGKGGKGEYWEYIQKSSIISQKMSKRWSQFVQQPFTDQNSKQTKKKYVICLLIRAIGTFGVFMGSMITLFVVFRDSFVEIRMPSPFLYPQFLTLSNFQLSIPILILAGYLCLTAISYFFMRLRDRNQEKMKILDK